MALTYSQIKTGLDQLAADIAAETNRISSGSGQIAMAQGNLAGFTAKYTSLIQAITTLYNAGTTDPAAMVSKSESDKLVAEYNTLKARADALVAALAAVG
jgi:hypothetical protein